MEQKAHEFLQSVRLAGIHGCCFRDIEAHAAMRAGKSRPFALHSARCRPAHKQGRRSAAFHSGAVPAASGHRRLLRTDHETAHHTMRHLAYSRRAFPAANHLSQNHRQYSRAAGVSRSAALRAAARHAEIHVLEQSAIPLCAVRHTD